MKTIDVHDSWKELLTSETDKPYMLSLRSFLIEEKKHHTVYPPFPLLFEAFKKTALSNLKVVILGQDPYHGPGQAHGLAFSVPSGIQLPPSLKNIYKELKSDIPGFQIPLHGDLSHWAEQGVLLLNTTLSVRARSAGSHQKKGWEQLTDTIITQISERKNGIIFILWGRHARNKKALINLNKHFVIESAHPSPLSAHNGFWGSKPFSETNSILSKQGLKPIDWQI